MFTGLSDYVNALGRDIRDAVSGDHHRLVLRLTLVLLLLHGSSVQVVQVPVQALSALMLVVPSLLSRALPWYLVTVALVVGNGTAWFSADNHKYLTMYWTLACALSLRQAAPQEWLGRVATALIGVVFGFAALWKLVAGEYIDGSFLYWTFLTDSRFQRLGAAVAGLSLDEVREFDQAVMVLGRLGATDVSVPVVESSVLWTLTLVLSWFALGLESLVAALHLIRFRGAYMARHVTLFLFVLGTYYLTPVFAFGFLLALLGLVQCRQDDALTKLHYLALIGSLHLTLIPWQAILLPG